MLEHMMNFSIVKVVHCLSKNLPQDESGLFYYFT